MIGNDESLQVGLEDSRYQVPFIFLFKIFVYLLFSLVYVSNSFRKPRLPKIKIEFENVSKYNFINFFLKKKKIFQFHTFNTTASN